MNPVLKAFLLLVGLIVLFAGGVVLYVVDSGLSAREQPGRIETFIARSVRSLAVSRHARELRNPVERSKEVVAEGRAHFADHCASCHENDGSGQTSMGDGLWPKPPDMRLAETQSLSDGELFYIIEQGIRFTGMPGWATGAREGEESSWHLVHFIRHLPDLSESELEEMEALNPRSPAEIRREIEEQRFLAGDDPEPAAPETPHEHQP